MSTAGAVVPLNQKVEFLSRPGVYPNRPDSVTAKESHMSWVFLAGDFAYKLKKPIRDGFDWCTADSRLLDCAREVELNQRLAASVYLGVVSLTSEPNGRLHLGGDGTPIDWLVKMRRLPESCMLDWLIDHQIDCRDDFRRAIELVCQFYRDSPPFQIAPGQFRDRLRQSLQESEQVLLSHGTISHTVVQTVHRSLQQYLLQQANRLDNRVTGGRVIDAHGDLRPEHIGLERPPVVIDCLQFSQRLRVLDTVSELSFLTLECERLGGTYLEDTTWSVYQDRCADQPPDHLVAFYKAYHACIRAMLSVRHPTKGQPDPTKWRRRAEWYVNKAHSLIASFQHSAA
jgi:aminoglycoside phosphotransferase family enzyme